MRLLPKRSRCTTTFDAKIQPAFTSRKSSDAQLIERFGKDAIYTGRLRVYTTIDPDMQKAAEAAVVSTLREIEARIKPPPPKRGRRGEAGPTTASRCRPR